MKIVNMLIISCQCVAAKMLIPLQKQQNADFMRMCDLGDAHFTKKQQNVDFRSTHDCRDVFSLQFKTLI